MITEEKKKNLLEGGFFYEFSMMMEGAFLIMSYRIPNTNKIKAPNIMLVGFYTHIRNLYEFFYDSGKRNRPHAKHYIESWENKKPPLDISKFNIDINIFLTHLSYSRTTKEWKPLPIDRVYFHFRDLTINFLSNLPKEYLTKKLGNLLKEIKKQKITKNL